MEKLERNIIKSGCYNSNHNGYIQNNFSVLQIFPSEENMENWHSQKLNKYTPLVKVIEENGWTVDLFAIKAGA